MDKNFFYVSRIPSMDKILMQEIRIFPSLGFINPALSPRIKSSTYYNILSPVNGVLLCCLGVAWY